MIRSGRKWIRSLPASVLICSRPCRPPVSRLGWSSKSASCIRTTSVSTMPLRRRAPCICGQMTSQGEAPNRWQVVFLHTSKTWSTVRRSKKSSCTAIHGGGQNKNFTMLSLMHLLVASAGGSLKLTHKFLVPGHTFLPCDRSFGVIDRARRHAMNIFVPEDWCHLVETCRRQNPFKVIRMKQDDFYTFKSVEQCMIKRTTTEDGQKVRFSKAASLEVSQPLKTLVKHSHGSMQPVKVLNHAPKRGKRPNLANSVLQGKYESPNQINPAKKADLVSLLHLIPPVHHGYYRALSTSHKTSAGTGKRGKGGKTTAAKRRSGGRRAAEESECEDFDSSSDSSCTQQV